MNDYKCSCGSECKAVNIVDASRTIIHKEGCTGHMDNITETKEKPKAAEAPKTTPPKKK